LPSPHFIFLNIGSPIVANNMMVGDRISSAAFTAIFQDASCATVYDDGSAQYAPKIRDFANTAHWVDNPNCLSSFLSMHTCSMFQNATYAQEYEGETIRLKDFPLMPSRFSCVFTFGTIDDCLKSHARHGWPKDRIRGCQIASWPRTRIARLSMDIVSILISSTHVVDTNERQELWRQYWRGASVRDIPMSPFIDAQHVERAKMDGEIWEHLVDGQLIVDRTAPIAS
jgi:hypothetical protein